MKIKNDANQRRALGAFRKQTAQRRTEKPYSFEDHLNDGVETLVSVSKKDCKGLDRVATRMNLHFKRINAPFISMSLE